MAIFNIYCKFRYRKYKYVFVRLFVSFSDLGSDKCLTLANRNNVSFLNGSGHIILNSYSSDITQRQSKLLKVEIQHPTVHKNINIL